MVDPQFRHALADRPYVAWVAECQPSDANIDPCTGFTILKAAEPPCVGQRLAYLEHDTMSPMGDIVSIQIGA